MNFLAHLYLAEPRGVASGAAMVGNLLPDFVRGRERLDLNPQVAAGAHRHRAVDRFTDGHAMFLRSRRRITDRLHDLAAAEPDAVAVPGARYAGILTDVFYDHVLSLAWSTYHAMPRETFIATAHERLAESRAVTPTPMRRALSLMIEQDWLSTYASTDGLTLTLERMSRRFTERFGREVRLQRAVAMLPDLVPGLGEDFEAFFPDLIAFVEASDEGA